LRFLDTNVLIYSISRDPAEAAKRDRAVALLDQDDNALSVQVLQEFYMQATRPTRRDPVARHCDRADPQSDERSFARITPNSAAAASSRPPQSAQHTSAARYSNSTAFTIMLASCDTE
jgi:predicted nucleic acid-binding protein